MVRDHCTARTCAVYNLCCKQCTTDPNTWRRSGHKRPCCCSGFSTETSGSISLPSWVWFWLIFKAVSSPALCWSHKWKECVAVDKTLRFTDFGPQSRIRGNDFGQLRSQNQWSVKTSTTTCARPTLEQPSHMWKEAPTRYLELTSADTWS